MARRIALSLALVFGIGCTSEQAWQFENGFGLPDEAPARIVAQVHEGGDCGFACRPPGAAVYCASISSEMRGPAPPDLERGQRYCFIGTAYDETGHSIGVGCAVATVGGGPISVTLSPSDEDRQPACGDGIDAGITRRDAGATDAGVRPDAAAPDAGDPADASLPQVDAGPPGLPVLSVVGNGNGGVLVVNSATRRGWEVGSAGATPYIFNLRVSAGNRYELTPRPDPGYRFSRFTGGGCDGLDVCTVTVTTDTRVELTFVIGQ